MKYRFITIFVIMKIQMELMKKKNCSNLLLYKIINNIALFVLNFRYDNKSIL